MEQKINEQLAIIKSFLNKRFFYFLGVYSIFVAAFALLSKLLSNIKFLVRIDVIIQQFIMNLRFEPLNKICKIITDLGDTKAMIVWTIIVASIFFWKKRYIYSLGIILSIGVAEFMAFILKNVVERHRPPAFMALVAESSPSFPSGHAIAAITFFGFLIYFFNKNITNKFSKNLLNFIFIIMIISSGLIRIYLGAHWPSDVMASYILGGVWLWIVINLIEKQRVLENR